MTGFPVSLQVPQGKRHWPGSLISFCKFPKLKFGLVQKSLYFFPRRRQISMQVIHEQPYLHLKGNHSSFDSKGKKICLKQANQVLLKTEQRTLKYIPSQFYICSTLCSMPVGLNICKLFEVLHPEKKKNKGIS